jgi:hypothetical protein
MIVLNVVLMALIGVAIIGLLTWAICTQHRDAGCTYLRVRRRLQIKARRVTLDEPEFVRESRIAL